MAKPQAFVDPETGLKRQREQRPEGEGVAFRRAAWCGWEIYRCAAEDCEFDTQYAEAMDLHYYRQHEGPALKEKQQREAAARVRERAERMKPGRE